MKKFTLSIILACLVGGTAMAQTFNFVERASLNLNGHLSSIPPVFSYGNHSEFYTWNEIGYDEYSFSVLDENFEVKNSFTTQCIVVELNINGVLGDNPLHLTQTLFNNDEKCEYLRGTRNEEGKTVGFSIVSEDGTVLKEVSFNFAIDYCYPTVFLLSDKCYLSFELTLYNDNNERERYSLIYEIERDVPSTPSVTPCDVNGDGNVTAADVTKVYDYLLNN